MSYDHDGMGQDVNLRISTKVLKSYCVPSKLIISISSKILLMVILFLLNMPGAAAQELLFTESRS